jgi:alginate O-acetyltransferase complex protein AlgI
MLFNSYEFLFLLLPLALAGYYLLPKALRLPLLTLLSYVFYGWWDYRFCALMLWTSVFDYAAGLLIGRAEREGTRRLVLTLSITCNLGLLGFFKYFDLLAGTMNAAATSFRGAPSELLPLLHLTLPVGISFYTFQSMSYTIDVYRRIVEPQRSFLRFAFFVSFFPQLVAGPIVRYRDLAEQLARRSHTFEKAARGISLFVVGLAKKVILADGVAPLASRVFDGPAAGFFETWAGVLAYAMQIYFDFSAYSDMAVGLGLLFGFEFPQNFNSPYKAVSITDFWRRWHMSLSTWLRDYLYVPLGGNRHGPVRTYVNLFITMLLGGLWHGANWTFVIWGGFHGILLAIERAVPGRSLLARAPAFLQKALTFGLVIVGWVFFRCATVDGAAGIFAGMAGLRGFAWGWFAGEQLHLQLLALAACMGIAWLAPNTWEIRWRHNVPEALILAALFVVCLGVMLVNASSPFLYFQF